MRSNTAAILGSITGFLAMGQAANIWGLPECASACVQASFGGCSQVDISCICKNRAFIQNLACCVSKSCDDDQQKETIQFAQNFCGAYKISNLPTAATCASTSTTLMTSATTTTTSMPDPSSATSLLAALSSAASMAHANVTNSTATSTDSVSVTVTATGTAKTKNAAVARVEGKAGLVWGVGALVAGVVVVVA